VHVYYLQVEGSGRYGQGGAIHPKELNLLKDEVLKLQQGGRVPTVKFTVTKKPTLEINTNLFRIRYTTRKTKTGITLTFLGRREPYEGSYIIKMWHYIEEESWKHVAYKQVAMLREDVLYMSPIDVYEYSDSHQVVVPGFGRSHPVRSCLSSESMGHTTISAS
jgi:hypothetical protein